MTVRIDIIKTLMGPFIPREQKWIQGSTFPFLIYSAVFVILFHTVLVFVVVVVVASTSPSATVSSLDEIVLSFVDVTIFIIGFVLFLLFLSMIYLEGREK